MLWPTGRELADLIEPVYFHAKDTKNAVLAEYEASIPEFTAKDPRVWALRQIMTSLQYAQLNSLHLEQNIASGKWWRVNVGAVATYEQLDAAIEYYAQTLVSSLVYMPFMHFESNLRRLVREIDEDARGSIPFKQVYASLLDRLTDEGWKGTRKETEACLDVYRLVRNAALHSDFVYTGASDQVVVWRGVPYEFRPGQSLDFADDADFSLGLIRELIDVTASIMRSPTAAALLRAIV